MIALPPKGYYNPQLLLKRPTMRTDIHPAYNPITVTCSCGNTFDTHSTLKGPLQIEICSACHPYYTGKQKLIDTAGRVDRFRQKYGKKKES